MSAPKEEIAIAVNQTADYQEKYPIESAFADLQIIHSLMTDNSTNACELIAQHRFQTWSQSDAFKKPLTKQLASSTQDIGLTYQEATDMISRAMQNSQDPLSFVEILMMIWHKKLLSDQQLSQTLNKLSTQNVESLKVMYATLTKESRRKNTLLSPKKCCVRKLMRALDNQSNNDPNLLFQPNDSTLQQQLPQSHHHVGNNCSSSSDSLSTMKSHSYR